MNTHVEGAIHIEKIWILIIKYIIINEKLSLLASVISLNIPSTWNLLSLPF